MLKTLNALVSLIGLALTINGLMGGAYAELGLFGMVLLFTAALLWIAALLGTGRGGSDQLTAFRSDSSRTAP